MAHLEDYEEALDGVLNGRYYLTMTLINDHPGYPWVGNERPVHVHVRPREGHSWPGFGSDLNHHFYATRDEAGTLERYGVPWSVSPKW